MTHETFEITEYDVDPAHVGARLRMAFMSDFHLGRYTHRAVIDAAVTACQALQPDGIMLGGDYLSGPYDAPFAEPLAEAFSALSAPLGVFYVLGNHDYVTGPHLVREAFNRRGLVDITNRNEKLTEGLHLCGVDDLWKGRPDVDRALAGTRPGERLVLSHNPKIFRRLRRHDCTVICGHTHGGQIRIPLVPNPALLTGKYPYIKGWYEEGSSQLYVNRGIGAVILPFRVNCRPEITVLRVPVAGPGDARASHTSQA